MSEYAYLMKCRDNVLFALCNLIFLRTTQKIKLHCNYSLEISTLFISYSGLTSGTSVIWPKPPAGRNTQCSSY